MTISLQAQKVSLEEELTPILHNLFRKYEEGLPNSFYEASIALTRQRQCQKKESYRPISSLMNKVVKVLNKILANRILQYIKIIIHHDQVELIQGVQGWHAVSKSINIIYINKLKKRKSHDHVN